jgi:hypothetical protein
VEPEKAARPLASPGGGKVGAGARVALSTATEGAEIYYTLDGDAPDSAGTKYTEAILIAGPVTIRAVAVKPGMEDSDPLEAVYELDPNTVMPPVADPPAGEVAFESGVILSTATEGAEIYYTTDGNEPDTTKTKYTGAIVIDAPMTIKAVAAKEGMKNSFALEAAYTIGDRAAKPAADPPAGELAFETAVTLSTVTEGAEIYYTIDGTAPDETGTKYTAPIVINASLTVKAIAIMEEMLPSAIMEAAYVVRAAAPAADPAPGELEYGATVTLSTATEGAEIYYTADGTAPDKTKTKYTAPIGITGAVVIKAIAVKDGLADSAVLEAAYTAAAAGTVARPSANPAAGEVLAGTKAALSSATEGAEIYYTVDGTAPDRTKTKYTAPVSIVAALTIKAVAVKNGLADSAVMEAAYTIAAAEKPAADPAAGELVDGTGVILSSATAGAEIYYTLDGTAPDRTKNKYTAPVVLNAALTIRAIAVKEGMTDSAAMEAAYTLKTAPPAASPPAGTVIIGTEATLSSATEGAEIYYTLDGTAPDRTKTRYTGPVSIVAAATIRAIAVKEGMADSEILEAAYTIAAAAKPVASPPAGPVPEGVGVTLSTATEGAEIYYTLDGSASDRTKTRYTAPVSIAAAVTIRAIAVKEGMRDSEALEAAYTVRAAKPVASPEAGEMPATGLGVALFTATPGADIYYTTDGSAPDKSKTKYAGVIPINAALTIKAVAAKPGMEDSEVLTAAYTVAATETPPEEEEPELPVVTRIEVLSPPDVTFYAKNQPYAGTAGLKVNEVYNDGSVKELFSYTLSPATVDTTKPGQKIVYVRSGGFSSYYTVFVDQSDLILTNMTLKHGPNKTLYELGQNFSKTGIAFTGTYSDGSTKEFDGGACSVSGYDRTKRGAQRVALKISGFSFDVDVAVRIPANAKVSFNVGRNQDILDGDYRHVFLKGMPFHFNRWNLIATVTVNGITALLQSGKDFALEEINLAGFNPNQPGKQTLSFDLDDLKGLSLWVFVADVAPAVWFDYGYQRTAADPNGIGPGSGKYYARPGETLVLAPVLYLIGWNDDHSPGYASYSWSVSGGSHTGVPSASGETYAFTPAATGTYTITVSVTGRNYVTGQTDTKTAVAEVVCYTGTVSPEKTFVGPLKNFAPGQYANTGSGYGWSLGSWGGYEMWRVKPQDSYQITGNPFSGWSEPGVVWVQEDRNNNGLPDEMWYELVGDMEGPGLTRHYAVTYSYTTGTAGVSDGAISSRGYSAWVDSKGRVGTMRGGWHKDVGDWVTFTGSLLADNGMIAGSPIGPGGGGYVDSMSSRIDWDYFYPSNAVRADGNPANLSAVHFIKVHTGLFKYGGNFGENSTEIHSAEFLGKQTDFPLPGDS